MLRTATEEPSDFCPFIFLNTATSNVPIRTLTSRHSIGYFGDSNGHHFNVISSARAASTGKRDNFWSGRNDTVRTRNKRRCCDEQENTKGKSKSKSEILVAAGCAPPSAEPWQRLMTYRRPPPESSSRRPSHPQEEKLRCTCLQVERASLLRGRVQEITSFFRKERPLWGRQNCRMNEVPRRIWRENVRSTHACFC